MNSVIVCCHYISLPAEGKIESILTVTVKSLAAEVTVMKQYELLSNILGLAANPHKKLFLKN